MPSLSIIPSVAIADANLSAADLRVLLAIGSHTDRYGANVWASARTLGGEARVSRAQFFASANRLESAGYVRRTTRWSDTGRQLTSMYEVVLTPALDVGRVQPALDGEGPEATGPKRYQRTRDNNIAPEVREAFGAVWGCYPPRPAASPHHFISALAAFAKAHRDGASLSALVQSAQRYASLCETGGTEPQYVRSLTKFYSDDFWRAHHVTLVFGRTREEWERSGQDVAEFDRLAAEPLTEESSNA